MAYITTRLFRHDEDDASTIGNDYIRFLHMNKKGELFIGTQRGIYLYHPLSESFSHVPSSGTKSIKEITTDVQGNLWYIAEGVLTCIKGNKAKTYDIAKYFWATSVCTASDGNLWIATADGQLKKYNPAGDNFNSYSVFGQPVPTQWIEKIYAAPNGSILIGTSAHGLLSFDITSSTTWSIIKYNSDQTSIYVRDILQRNDDEYWVATESGIFVYNTASGSIINLKKDYHDPYSISDNAVYTLCKDKEGGLWAGTFFGGMNYYVEQHAIFQKYFPDRKR